MNQASNAVQEGPPRALVALLTVATGLAVGNLYYAQPLAASIAGELGASVSEVGSAMTLMQVGYAIGMFFLVPLGDGRERRSLIVWTSSACVAALIFVGLARSITVLSTASLLLGASASVAQMIVPYGVALAGDAQRGRVLGSMMAGLLTGILAARIASGAAGAVLGWRAVYFIAAGLMAALTLLLRAALPVSEPATRMRWAAIQRSLAHVFAEQPRLRQRAYVGALGMACFSVFWSMLSFQLGELGHGSSLAGAFGFLGIAGVLIAPLASRLASQKPPAWINLAGLSLAAVSYVLMLMGARSLFAIGAGVVLLDAGVQASHLANQNVIFSLAPEQRNRLNALYMVCYFVGGALGTFVASLAWAHGGWSSVCVVGAACALLGLTPVLRELRR